jgi:hypothetical protein
MKNRITYYFLLLLFTSIQQVSTAQNFIDDTNDISLLPVKLLSFSAKQQQSNVLLSWSTATEINNSHFVVQRSIDGINFKNIATVKGTGNSNLLTQYSYADMIIPTQNLYYRLEQIDYNVDSYTSNTLLLMVAANTDLQVLVYPNPVQNKKLVLHLSGNDNGKFTVCIKSVTGAIVYSGIIDKQTTSIYTIQLPEALKASTYFVEIINTQKTTRHVKTIVVN